MGDGEGAARAVVELEENVGVVFGVDFDAFVIGGLEHLAGVGLDFFLRLHAGFVDRAQVGKDFGDLAARDKLDAIAPVGADIGDGAGFATELRDETPVPIGREIEPVLGVGAVGVEDVAELAAFDHGLGFLDERIIAIVEIDRVDHAGFGGELHQLFGFGSGHRERFFGNDVLAGGDDFLLMSKWRWFGVQLWTTSISLSARNSSTRAVGFGDAELVGFGLGEFGARFAKGDHFDKTEPAGGLDVCRVR